MRRKDILILLVLLAVLLIHSMYLRMITDDAFISFRYARNLADGQGLVWNIGERPVEGYTNFLWVIILSCFSSFGINLEQASEVLGILSAMATLFLVAQTKEKTDLLAAALLAFSGPFACWATGGLETSFFTFLIFLGFFLYQKQKLVPSGVIFFLASLTRPEGLLVFFITFLHCVISCANRKSRLSFLISFLLPFSIYFTWRYSYFGFFLPNTFYTKVGSTVWQALRGMKYTLIFSGITVLPLLLFARPFLGKLTEGEKLIHGIVVSYTLYIMAVGGDYMAMFRFFVPLLPWIALIAAGVLREGSARLFPGKPASAALGICVLFAVFLLPSFPLEKLKGYLPLPQIYWNARYDSYQRMAFERWQVNRLSAIGHWFKENLPAGSSVACQGIGAIGYYSELPIYDLNGLTIVEIAHKKEKKMGKGLAGHEKEDFPYVLSLKPDYILGSRYLAKGTEESFGQLYEGKLFHYSPNEQQTIIRILHEEYEQDYRWFEDQANQEMGYLRLLRRKDHP